jgi:hypothetical protein
MKQRKVYLPTINAVHIPYDIVYYFSLCACAIVHLTDKKQVLQVPYNVTEASGAGVIAAVAIVAISAGSAVLLAFDAVALKATGQYLIGNIRAIASK